VFRVCQFVRLSGVILLASVTAIGCGGAGGGTVSGKVSYQGTSLTAGAVTFYGKDGKTATAVVQADGTYTAKNVPIGEAKVAVSVPNLGAMPKGGEGPAPKDGSSAPKLTA
jgi:hypothetical protein